MVYEYFDWVLSNISNVKSEKLMEMIKWIRLTTMRLKLLLMTGF